VRRERARRNAVEPFRLTERLPDESDTTHPATRERVRTFHVSSDAVVRRTARLNVTRAVRSVLRRVHAAMPKLGRHLDASLRTGAVCSDESDEISAVRWEILDATV